MDSTVQDGSGNPAAQPVRLSRTERREKAVSDALRTLIRDLHLEQFGVLPPGQEDFPLRIDLTVHPNDNWALHFSPPLADQVGRQVEDACARHGVFSPGRVFCFRCESSGCDHAAPPSALSVFKGYTEMGFPDWQDLHQVFVEARDERVGRLFEGQREVLARVQLGHGLRERQLSSFGRSSKTYALLGQVVAGYFILPRSVKADDPARRLAMTFQVVEIRGAGGRLALELNTLACLGVDLDELLGSDWEPWVHRARELARHALENVEHRVQVAREAGRTEEVQAALRRIPSILKHLAEFLERGHRQDRRRTQHVEARRHEHRPVHKALEDAREAPPESVFHDDKTGTTVICGPQGRAHVFNEKGRHVTSFALTPDAIEFRLRTQRWRRATREEAVQFRDLIRKSERPES
jgi:hypothetical protein